MKTGIVDVGGGQRGIYASGVFDFCLEQNITFDLGIGVSAGSANLSSFAARQHGRNVRFYTQYARRKQYMSLHNFLFHHSYIDLDYVYSVLSNEGGEDPLDFETLQSNPMEMLVVAENALSGEPTYFSKKDMEKNHYDIMKASCAIPYVCKPYEVHGIPYYDGALANPVPVDKALEWGCERVVLILTRPLDYVRSPKRDEKIARRIEKKYPAAAAQFRLRAEKYNRGVQHAKELAAKGNVCIIAPKDTTGLDTLTRDPDALLRFYEQGKNDAKAIIPFLKKAVSEHDSACG